MENEEIKRRMERRRKNDNPPEIDPIKVRERLKYLRELKKREEGNWTQTYLAEKLGTLVGVNVKEENGKKVVSELERGKRNLTPEIAYAYSKIFGVSLDYLYGISDNFRNEYEIAGTVTGLSNKAIEKLWGLVCSKSITLDIFNNLIECDSFVRLLDSMIKGYLARFKQIYVESDEGLDAINARNEFISFSSEDLSKEESEKIDMANQITSKIFMNLLDEALASITPARIASEEMNDKWCADWFKRNLYFELNDIDDLIDPRPDTDPDTIFNNFVERNKSSDENFGDEEFES